MLRAQTVYCVPRGDGRYVIGATMEHRGEDRTVTAWAVHDLLRELFEVLPAAREFVLEEALAGLRPPPTPATRSSARPPAIPPATTPASSTPSATIAAASCSHPHGRPHRGARARRLRARGPRRPSPSRVGCPRVAAAVRARATPRASA